jgi:hypothetical protein
MIGVGDMVSIQRVHGSSWYEEKSAGHATVLKVEEPVHDTTERMALVLRPSGETRWEFLCNLVVVSPAGDT